MIPDPFRLLLRLYPRGFRREYGDQIVEAFREMRRAEGRTAIGFWRFVLADVCRSALRQQLEACRTGARRIVLEWIAACALGVLFTSLLANALAWSFSYLYHPYLEGRSVPAWAYGALLGLGLGLAQSVALGRRVRLGLAWMATNAAAAAIGLQIAVAVADVAGWLGTGVALGSLVGSGQWLVLRTRVRSAGWWVLGSTAALSVAALSCAAVVRTSLAGMDALIRAPAAVHPAASAAALDSLVRGLFRPTTFTDLMVELAATCGLAFAALTVRRRSSALL
jgi:hypothetical protein